MHIHSKFRRRLLGSSALVAGAFLMATSGAQAGVPSGSCVGGPVANNVTVTCSGYSGYGVTGEGDHVTVTLNPDAEIYTEGSRGLDLSGANNTVTFGTNSVMSAYDDNKAANFDGNNNAMTLNGGSELTLNMGRQSSGTALDIDGDDNTLTLNAASSINISGTSNNNYADMYAVNIRGDRNNVTLNGGSEITLDVTINNANTNSTALFVSGLNNAVTLNNSSVTAHAFNEHKYAGRLFGAQISGSGSSLTLNGTSLIDVRADNDDKYANNSGHTFGVQINGDDTALALNGSSQIHVYANNRNENSYTFGVQTYGEGATVTLNGSSKVAVDVRNYGRYGTAKGVDLQGDDAKLTLNGTSSIDVNAAAYASYSQFYGAAVGGLTPVVTLNDASSINLTGTGSGNNSSYTGLAVSERGTIDYDQTIADVTVGRVTLNGSSSVNVTLNDQGSRTATGVDLGGDRRQVRSMYAPVSPSLTLNGSSSINVKGVGSFSTYIGVNARNKYANITLNDQSSINVSSDGYNRASKGISAYADNATITLNGHAAINVGNAKYVTGIALSGSDSQVTLNGDASIHVTAGLWGSNGVVLDGQRDTLTFNDNSSLVVDGGGNAILVSNRSNNSIELNGTSSVTATNGVGVYVDQGYNNALTLNGNATINANSDAVLLYRTDTSVVTLNGTSKITSVNGAGIRVTGESSYYNSYYEETYFYHSRNATIVVGKDATVSGTTGILVEDNAENTFVHVSGTVIGTDGTAIDFTQANNSTLELGTGANIDGSIAGSGSDSLILTGVGRLSNTISGFNYLSVQADKDGIWNLTSTLNLGSGSADITSGTLAVNGTLLASGGIYVAQGGTLGGSGTVTGDVTVAGTVSPGNSPGTLNVVGNVTFTPGSGFKVQVEGNKADLLNVTGGNVTIDPGTSITMEFLGGVDGFVGDVISSTAPVVGTFTTFIGGVFDYSTPGFVSLTSASPSAPNAGMTGGTVVGFTFLDAVIDNAENGIGRSSGLWGTGLYNQTNRSSMGSSKGSDVQGSGLAMGGDVFRTENFGVGLAGGYIDSTATTQGGGSDTDIKGYNVAAYSTYSMGNTFLTAAATAAYQNQDVTRRVLSMGTVTAANSSPDAWTTGAGASLGHTIPLQGTWTITPRASVGWQHFARDGYSEAGGGLGAMSLDSVQSDTMRGQVGAELAFTIKDPNAIWSVRPSVRAALAKELRSGDSTVNGRFLASGAAFSGKVDDRDQTYTAIGAGVDVVVGAGLTAFVQYDGSVGGEIEKSGGVRVGARFEW
ncbi:MAG: autotransporter domain-containing protein [Parvibaculaceae bacterium]